MPSIPVVTPQDILLKLCHSVSHILSTATSTDVTHAGMVQSITRTCLKPDLGCFSIFDGGFSGLVVINFSAPSAIEIYRAYMMQMGMPESELAFSHTSDEVANVMGELMNQILGDFINKVSQELQSSISQSQPKMLTINKEITLSVDTNLTEAISRRVAFKTGNNHSFYLEFAMDKTEFISLNHEIDHKEQDPDRLLETHGKQIMDRTVKLATTENGRHSQADEADELLHSLGL
ncbi:DUF3334 family protein [Shewanella surugensis]|uniref:DUF3334 family protein n=1 Tax=Shewanella surugensis TaxID=212020 RepID=A0ABT0LCR8_9GAMM|nr:DUF3334 family protein [Shewanella surugensis]MCL1125474.1 DUF3334 family protein [Shewanella surugensis]